MNNYINSLPSVKIGVAVSGGADSMLLCFLTHSYCLKYGIPFEAIIIDHKLRLESTKEVRITEQFLVKNGILAKVITWEGTKPQANIQAKAREARYRLLAQYCNSNAFTHLLTGHHMNDQAETIFMRIIRGSGVDGINGISPVSEIYGIKLIRPLLQFSRSQIITCMNQIQWPYVDDPSNKNTKFKRVLVRSLLAHHDFEKLSDRLILLGENASRVSDYLHKQTAFFIEGSCKLSNFGTACLDYGKFTAEHIEIALRALVKILMLVGGNTYPPRLKTLKLLYQKLLDASVNKLTAGGCIISLKKNKILFVREYDAIPKHTLVVANQPTIWDNRFIINSGIDGYIAPIAKQDFHFRLKPLLNKLQLVPAAEIIETLPAFYDNEGFLILVPNVYFVGDCNIEVIITRVNNSIHTNNPIN
jgi:tRNA(Ile)-lysidine synthase